MNFVRMTHAGGAAVFLLMPLLVRASLGDLCERAHLKRALDRRADANKNIVLVVSNAAATPAFMEMTSWWVKDMQKTNTPYLFMTMSDEQCEAIEILIDEALSGGAARNRKLGRHMPRCGRCESGLPPKKDRMRDHMMLMRLRYNEGPGGGGHCFENSEQAPSAIRHCVGKQPECLYPKHRRAITKDPLHFD